MSQRIALCTAPTTGNERSRLDLQHQMLTLIFGGLYYPPDLFEKVITEVSATRRRPNILDVGTGSGAWAEAVAAKFPNVDVTAVDLAPPVSTEYTPPNCRFCYEDFNNGFSHYNEQFDIIHMRMINHGAKDFKATMHDTAEILRPGGALIVGAGVVELHDDQRRPMDAGVEGEDGFCALQSIYKAFSAAAYTHTPSADAHYHLEEWLKDDIMYEKCGGTAFVLPVGTWKTDSPNEIEAGAMQAENIKMILPKFVKFSVENGIQDEETMQRWWMAAIKEIDDPNIHRAGTFRWAWAARSQVKWKPSEKMTAVEAGLT